MLHLLAPHTCPACGGPHRATEQATSRPTAAELRPYYGTYMPLMQGPLVYRGAFQNTNMGPPYGTGIHTVAGGFAGSPLYFDAPSTDLIGIGNHAGANQVQVPYTGRYYMFATIVVGAGPGGGTAWDALWAEVYTGAWRDADDSCYSAMKMSGAGQAGNLSCAAHADLNAGDWIRFEGAISDGTWTTGWPVVGGNNLYVIEFVPTRARPRLV